MASEASNQIIGQVLSRIGDFGNRTRTIDRLRGIAEAYEQALGRAPDAGGLEAFFRRFESSGKDVDVGSLANELRESPEGRQRIEGLRQQEEAKKEQTRQTSEEQRLKAISEGNKQLLETVTGRQNLFQQDITQQLKDLISGVQTGQVGLEERLKTGQAGLEAKTTEQLTKLQDQLRTLEESATKKTQLEQADIEKRKTDLRSQITNLTSQLGLTPEGIQAQQAGLGTQLQGLVSQLGLTPEQRQQAVQDLLGQQLNLVARQPFEQAQQAAMRAGEQALEARGLTRSGGAPELAQNVAGQIGLQRAQAQSGAFQQANTLQQQLQGLAAQLGQFGIGAEQQLAARLGGQAQQLGQFGTQLGEARTSEDLGRLAQLVSQFSGQQAQAGLTGFGAQTDIQRQGLQNLLGLGQFGLGQRAQVGQFGLGQQAQLGQQGIQNLLSQGQFGLSQLFQGGEAGAGRTQQRLLQDLAQQFQSGEAEKGRQFDLTKLLQTAPKPAERGPLDFLKDVASLIPGVSSGFKIAKQVGL